MKQATDKKPTLSDIVATMSLEELRAAQVAATKEMNDSSLQALDARGRVAIFNAELDRFAKGERKGVA